MFVTDADALLWLLIHILCAKWNYANWKIVKRNANDLGVRCGGSVMLMFGKEWNSKEGNRRENEHEYRCDV